jgi:hypothetical protein
MIIRNVCIWCNSKSLTDYFKDNYSTPIASYMQENLTEFEIIPYNVQKCEECKSYQIKYLAEVYKVYKYNHAYSYGSTLKEMCNVFSKFILLNSGIKSILEIGAGNGFLADIITKNNKDISYTIVDPSYFGNKDNKIIINSIIEEYNTENCNNDTVIMSHVFEHFYEPVKIINILKAIKNLKNVMLNMPNLELYLKNNTFHVLNTEHTYFIENSFLEDIFRIHGYKLHNKLFFKEHSVFFHFIRMDELTTIDKPINVNSTELVSSYFNKIHNLENIISLKKNNNPVYLWPCSMHSQFLLNFWKDPEVIKGLLDNSPDKIGKYLYGFKIPCISFKYILDLNIPSIVILNGGCFNVELETILSSPKYNNIEFIIV